MLRVIESTPALLGEVILGPIVPEEMSKVVIRAGSCRSGGGGAVGGGGSSTPWPSSLPGTFSQFPDQFEHVLASIIYILQEPPVNLPTPGSSQGTDRQTSTISHAFEGVVGACVTVVGVVSEMCTICTFHQSDARRT